MLTILGRATSINVRKVLWTADELGLEYELDLWGLPHRAPNTDEFRAFNPNAQVPVLKDGAFVLWESSAIMRYLIDAYGPGELMPSDPFTRAVAEQWFAWQATDLNASWRYAVMARVRKLPGYDDDAQIAVFSRSLGSQDAYSRSAFGGDESLCRRRRFLLFRHFARPFGAPLVWRRFR